MKSLPSDYRASKGAALMIVLAFVVLLTGLALAYFSRTTTDRQLAHSSYHDTSADVLARSALDIVVNDFKQEIITNPTVTTANIQPSRYGDASIPNLIRRSYSGASQSRASTVSSTAVSANGRSINTTRWNTHYLIPRGNPGDIRVNPSPIPTFVAPDWVLVTPQGPNTAPAASAVIGRYAFAVYDEGGLLDMNIAGFPNWSGNPGGGCNPAPTPWLTNVGRKGTVGFADLTGLGTYAPPQTQIDNIVGWRNYATTLRTGASFGSFSYTGETDCTKQDSYGSYLLDFGDPPFTFDLNDQPVPIPFYPFSAVYSTTAASRTDQAFMTRQQLLKLRNSLGFSQNVLQYMGTFSRERNRPAPDWPHLQNNLTEGRFCFENLDLVKPNPDNSCGHGRGKGKSKGKGRGHLCGTQEDIVNLFGLLWIQADPNASPTPRPGYWRYIDHVGKNWDHNNPNPSGKIKCWKGSKQQNDFFQILHYALNRVACANGQQPGNLARTFAIGASLIDQFDDSSGDDDLDAKVAKRYQTHTTVIEYAGDTFAYGMETTNDEVPCDSSPNKPHRPCDAPAPNGNTKVADHAFTSAGEFGYAIDTSDASLPTLNFYSATTSDAAVLDFFAYNPINSVYPRAGIVNLNTKNIPVLAATIKGAVSRDGTTNYVSGPTATSAATAIVNATATQPALTRADVARLVDAVGTTIGTTEEEKETIARALAELGQTRAWNLLIDVIVQTGRYSPDAANIAQADKFNVEGEKRYWLHVALGRDLNDDGSVDVLGTQLEGVIE
jgi:hypothetical protein